MINKNSWTEFSPFPSPLQRGYLLAPFGAGVYELKNVKTKELVYIGEGNHVALRMTSLLPTPFGEGTRNNLPLRSYIIENINDIHYRTFACSDKSDAKQLQDRMMETNKYIFN
jgi:hypothetical protein